VIREQPLPSFVVVLLGLALAACSRDPAAVSAQPPPPAPPARANRLAQETSPYLLQHAHNPVDWYPWGEAAFAKAKLEGKPVFLSVGYSSCHWCHVMERESFMDEEIAAFLNEHFVCVKVDREERPDVDSIYMTSVQIYNQVTGGGRGGGWPMSVFMTPEAKPFFGGTYFPARDGDRGAGMGFLTLIQRVHEFWTQQRENIERDAETITQLVRTELDGRRPGTIGELSPKLLDELQATLAERYDPVYGGFSYDQANPARPKFPEPSNLLFLIDRRRRADLDAEKRAEAERLLVGTLERMAMGGIRDHIGGGFHRYSVDRYWRIPHFEKMLYDNGQLATIYTEAYLLTRREDFKRVVDELLEFVRREMTAEGGAFYSALDADSEHQEGKFYRWERGDVEKLLEEDDFQLFAEVYGLHGPPNFEEQYYAPQLDRPATQLAGQHKLSEGELDARLAPMRAKLLAARGQRVRPLTDTKILTSWNGLMIRGLADAGRGLKNPAYVQAAVAAAHFLLNNLRTDDGRLLRTHSQGEAKLNAYLDDYAFFVDGLIALHRATDDPQWLAAADELTAKQVELFWDDDQGGFFFTSGDHESLLARGRDPVDGVEPSGNSVSAANLVFLGRQLKRPDYLDKAQRTIESVSGILRSTPVACPRLAVAYADWLVAPQQE